MKDQLSELIPGTMGIFRAIICILFPPLAVIDKGCGAVLLVLLLTICGWIPGVIAAILFNTRGSR